MSINEPEDSERLVTSPVFGQQRGQIRLALTRGLALSEGQDSDAAEEDVIAPVHIGRLQRLAFPRSPAPSEGQDSDATDEGVIAPVRIGHLQRAAFSRSPALSDGQDSDTTGEGVIAPVAIGNQQRLPFASPAFDDSQDSDIEEVGAQINVDIDLRAATLSVSNDVPGRPSVIIIRDNSSNLETGQNTDGSDILPPVQQNFGEGREDTEEVVLVPDFLEFDQSDIVMQDEATSNEPSEIIQTLALVPTVDNNIAGPSNRPVGIPSLIQRDVVSSGDAAQDENAIIPVVISYPTSHVRSDTLGPATSNIPGGNDEGTSEETAQAVPAPQANVIPQGEAGPRADDTAIGRPSTSEAADHERLPRDDSVPPCKRQRLSSDSSPAIKKEAPVIDSDEDDGLTCTICLDHWTSSGEHRLVSLKCGHMFGFACIERWIKNQKPAERKCPTCKSKTKMADVRNLYGHLIQMVDTTELEELRGKNKDLERVKEDLMREVGYMRKQNDELQVKHREALMEIQKLKSEKMVSQRPKKGELPHLRYRAQLVQTLELSKNEGCRVLTFNEVRSIIAASLPSPTNLFKEYALKLIDAESFRPRQTMPSHSRMIRDVAFSNDGKLLLSCSLDKTANVLCMDSNASIATFHSEMPVWSVCWDADNPWLLFTGAQNGVVQQFDVRSPGQEVSRIVTEGNPTPVASLAGIPKNSGVGWPNGGLLSCRFRQLYPYERTSTDTFVAHPCSIDGAFTSLRYEKRTEHFLVSTRPTERSPRAQHMLFQMSVLEKVPQYNLVHNFFGSTTLGVISRSCVIPILSPQSEVQDLLVGSYVESESHIGLWSCSMGQKLQSIQSSEIIMDLCPIFANGKNYLSTLSDKRLRLYKVEKS